MVVALVALMAACLGFGIVPTAVLAHVFGPAAGALLSGGQYARNLLTSGGTLPVAHVHFHYLSLTELAIVAVTVVLAVPVALWAGVGAEPGAGAGPGAGRRVGAGHGVDTPVVRRLRSVQTGSVNDYATYLVVGLIVTVATLALA